LNDLLEKLDKTEGSQDLDHPKEVLMTCWEQISQDLMKKVIDQWLDRISLVIRTTPRVKKTRH